MGDASAAIGIIRRMGLAKVVVKTRKLHVSCSITKSKSVTTAQILFTEALEHVLPQTTHDTLKLWDVSSCFGGIQSHSLTTV